MLQFDAETARLLENAYRGSDFVRRRLATLEALASQAGETIVDVGSGLGHLTVELSRAVGDAGAAIGVDPSADMRTAAVSQCDDLPNVRILVRQRTLRVRAGNLQGASCGHSGSVNVDALPADFPLSLRLRCSG